jgi:hypothetical protein
MDRLDDDANGIAQRLLSWPVRPGESVLAGPRDTDLGKPASQANRRLQPGVFSGYLDFYNRSRPHSSLDGSTPDQAYFTDQPIRTAAYPRQTLHLSMRKICSDNRDHLSPARQEG